MSARRSGASHPGRQSTMGLFSCFSRAKTVDAIDGGDIMYNMDGLELKEGTSPGGSPGRNRRAPGSDSLNSSPRKRIDYDALVKAKHMPGTNVHAVATASSGAGGQGNVELANARALVRALARKPESRQVESLARCSLCHTLSFKKRQKESALDFLMPSSSIASTTEGWA